MTIRSMRIETLTIIMTTIAIVPIMITAMMLIKTVMMMVDGKEHPIDRPMQIISVSWLHAAPCGCRSSHMLRSSVCVCRKGLFAIFSAHLGCGSQCKKCAGIPNGHPHGFRATNTLFHFWIFDDSLGSEQRTLDFIFESSITRWVQSNEHFISCLNIR